ncbi:integrase [Pseudomonas neustonica]|uniref:Integrase n=1 Tax=Pseudomonas neustonica TaxID=2487346 RepID=A0ABX9XJ16_9PSED|nr:MULTISPECIES: integrase [Pseudomonas]ROZ80932.1 integrase [Pseudomonas sp. SSM44]ROZ82130.1 integrase [Pseudomonas neustonica]|tara:strand:- start:470 stop:1615 length:1146 start_codon:yes stop_codon:yes gene_type:complete
MRRGRKRKHNPHIPAHIDQAALPNGVYFDHRGEGCWYRLSFNEAGRRTRQNICGSKITLSELHRLIEDIEGIDTASLDYLFAEFHGSDQFKQLSLKSRKDYEYCRDVLAVFPTKLDQPLGKLAVRRFTAPMIQRIIDKLADSGPSKAAHCLRYLRRVMQWGRNRGYLDDNPAKGLEAPKERKQRRLPDTQVMNALIQRAQQRGQLSRGQLGACSPYLWIVMELSYLCRLRGIETITLTDANERPEGILTNRRKGSRDNIVGWTPRLQNAWNAAKAIRAQTWEKRKTAVNLQPSRRPIIVGTSGRALSKSGLDTAWQRFITAAIEDGVLTPEQRFGMHDFKRKGITDTKGTRADKQQASGHKDQAMMDVYDLSVPTVRPSAD